MLVSTYNDGGWSHLWGGGEVEGGDAYVLGK